jgi:hypothetical protein
MLASQRHFFLKQETRLPTPRAQDLVEGSRRLGDTAFSRCRDSPPPGTLRGDVGSSLEHDAARSSRGDGMFIPDEDEFNDVSSSFLCFMVLNQCFVINYIKSCERDLLAQITSSH